MNVIWFSPPILFLAFLLLGVMLLLLGRHFAAQGEENPAKHIHYSCGEDLDVPHFELNYHAFFRLALLFGILHIVALTISTIFSTGNATTKFYAVLYVLGAAVSMFILLESDDTK